MDSGAVRRRVRRNGAGVALLVGLSAVGVSPAVAAPGFDPTSSSSRVAGADRYETAALAATANWSSSRTVIVVSGEGNGIDALAASFLAGVKDAPILLTRRDGVPDATARAIATLNPSEVIVLGDTASVSAATFTQLTAGRSSSSRIAGVDRYDTAAKVVAAAKAALPAGAAAPTSVFLARGDVFGDAVAADALAASPVAFRAKVPILLTPSDDLPSTTRDALAEGGFRTVYPLGSSASVSDAVVQEATGAAAGSSAQRLSGADRTSTAQAIANSQVAASAGFNKVGVVIANGARIDALAAGPAAGRSGFPLLLTASATDLGAGTQAYLAANAGTLTVAKVYGDATAVAPSATSAAQSAAGGLPGSGTTTPTPTAPLAPVSGLVTDAGSMVGTVSVAVTSAAGGSTFEVLERRDSGSFAVVTGRNVQAQYTAIGGTVTFARPTAPGVYSYQVRSVVGTQTSTSVTATGAVTVLPSGLTSAAVTTSGGTVTVTPTGLAAGASLVVSEQLGSGTPVDLAAGSRSYAVNSSTGAVSFTAPTVPGVYTYAARVVQNGQSSAAVAASPTVPIAPVAPSSASAALSGGVVSVTVVGLPSGATPQVQESFAGGAFTTVPSTGRSYAFNATTGVVSFTAQSTAGTYTYRVASVQNGQTSSYTTASGSAVVAAPDTTPPTVDRATSVVGTSNSYVVVFFNENISIPGGDPSASDFSLSVGGQLYTPSSDPGRASSRAINVFYFPVDPTGGTLSYTPGLNRISDAAGNQVAAFSVAVTP